MGLDGKRRGSRPTPGRRSQSIDLAHLARMTLGERGLEAEVLALFDRQAAVLLARMGDSTPAAVAAFAHTLKGSARGIGAWRVAEAADAVEMKAGPLQRRRDRRRGDQLGSRRGRGQGRHRGSAAPAQRALADSGKSRLRLPVLRGAAAAGHRRGCCGITARWRRRPAAVIGPPRNPLPTFHRPPEPMPKITYIGADGTSRTVEAETGSTVMEAAIKQGVPGIEAECGGACACATCHVYVDEAWRAIVGEPSPMEEDMLDFGYDVKPNSRSFLPDQGHRASSTG